MTEEAMTKTGPTRTKEALPRFGHLGFGFLNIVSDFPRARKPRLRLDIRISCFLSLFAAILFSIGNSQSAICQGQQAEASAGNSYPSWWLSRNVITNVSATNDFAAVNQGQIKWIASNACDELDACLPGDGAGTALRSLVRAFSQQNNYAAVNAGQFKSLATNFYNRLIEVGYTNAYPWTETESDDADFSLVNIGQVKQIFSFDVSFVDMDDDGMADWWEMNAVTAFEDDNVEMIEHLLPQDDFDGDGVANSSEWRFGTDPTNQGSYPPIIGFETAGQAVSETNASVTVPVVVNMFPPAKAAVSARIYIADATAQQGVDYAFTTQTLVFAAGETNKQVSFMVLAEGFRAVLEPQEYVVLALDRLTGPALIGTGDRHVIRIGDWAPDTDGDGLPDWWEATHFGSITAADPAADPDGDGWSNLAEYKRGGNPRVRWRDDKNNSLGLEVVTPLRK